MGQQVEWYGDVYDYEETDENVILTNNSKKFGHNIKVYFTKDEEKNKESINDFLYHGKKAVNDLLEKYIREQG